MKPEYLPITDEEKLGYLVEECGEVLAATGKTLRWGLESSNPELPVEERETNRDWLRRELVDLKRAIAFAEEVLDETGLPAPTFAAEPRGPRRDAPGRKG